jgi:putative copper resistance protein D
VTDAISIWLHVLAVTLWVGPQVFLFAAAIPALRTIEDVRQRTGIIRVLVVRFGWIGWTAMGVIVLTGIWNLVNAADVAPVGNAGDLLSSDLRFTRIFWEKMLLVAIAFVLTALHTFVVGPRQLRLMEEAPADDAAIHGTRRLSIIISSVALLASIGAIYMGALLSNHEYSFVPD